MIQPLISCQSCTKPDKLFILNKFFTKKYLIFSIKKYFIFFRTSSYPFFSKIYYLKAGFYRIIKDYWNAKTIRKFYYTTNNNLIIKTTLINQQYHSYQNKMIMNCTIIHNFYVIPDPNTSTR